MLYNTTQFFKSGLSLPWVPLMVFFPYLDSNKWAPSRWPNPSLPCVVSCWQTRASGVQEDKVSYLGNFFWRFIRKKHKTGSQGTWILVFILSLGKSFQLSRPQFQAECGHWISDSHSWECISHLGSFKRPGCQRWGPESI